MNYGRLHYGVSGKTSVPSVPRVAGEEGLSNVRLLPIVGLMTLLTTWKSETQRATVNDFAESFPKVVGYKRIQEGIDTRIHVCQYMGDYLYHDREGRDFKQG